MRESLNSVRLPQSDAELKARIKQLERQLKEKEQIYKHNVPWQTFA
jgi:hypothetical protein